MRFNVAIFSVGAFVLGAVTGYAVHSHQVSAAYIKVENLVSTHMITESGRCIIGHHAWNPRDDGFCYMQDAPRQAFLGK